MSRSTARFPSSGGRSAALLLTAGAASVALLSACGTGQVAQTAQKVAAVEGVSASVGAIDVDNAIVAFPAKLRYAKGSEAPFYLAISNDSLDDDRLIAAHSDAGTAVVLAPAEPGTTPPPLGCVITAAEIEENVGGVTPSSTQPPVEASASPTASPSESASASASPSASASRSGSAEASASPTPEPTSTEIAVTIPHDGGVLLTQACPHLVVQGLKRDVMPSDTIPLTLTFEKAGVIKLDVPVATASSPLPREAVPGFNPHGGGAEAEHGTTGGHGASAEPSHSAPAEPSHGGSTHSAPSHG